MMELNNLINTINYKGLQKKTIIKDANLEQFVVCLEKGAEMPKHITPITAQLLVLEGTVTYCIDGDEIILSKHQHFTIPKDEIHWVVAKENSKFIVTR